MLLTNSISEMIALTFDSNYGIEVIRRLITLVSELY